MKSIRAIVIQEAKRQGLSGYALAKLAGLPMRAIQSYLAGGNDIKGERLAAVLDALGLEIRATKRKGV